MPNGLSSEQMLERLYTVIAGIGGDGGMQKDMREVRDQVETLKESVITKAQCLAAQTEMEHRIQEAVSRGLNGKKRATGLMLRDIIVTVFGAGGIGTVLLLLLLGKK